MGKVQRGGKGREGKRGIRQKREGKKRWVQKKILSKNDLGGMFAA